MNSYDSRSPDLLVKHVTILIPVQQSLVVIFTLMVLWSDMRVEVE